MAKPIGKVTHYFDKLGVAILNVTGTLKVGDKIKFVRHDEDLFEQEIDSMQVDHKSVKKAGKKDDVAIKVDSEVKEGTEMYKA